MFKTILAKSKGFTLVEVVMILVIIGVGSLIITPGYEKFVSSWDLESETMKLKTKIREAQQLAITKQQTSRLEFDVSADSYSRADSPPY